MKSNETAPDAGSAESPTGASKLRLPASALRTGMFLVPSSLLVAHLVRTRAPERWRKPLLVGTLAVTLTAAVAARSSASLQAMVFVDNALVGERARAGEAEIGNLIADALRAATGANVALVAAAEIKDVTLGPGNLSVSQVVDALVYGSDPVVVLPLSGATIRQALEIAVQRHPVKHRGFLQVSGMEFTFDASREEGRRVVSITVGGKPMRDADSYRVAMSSSLAAGSHGYLRLWNRDRTAGEKGITVASALQSYLRDHTSLSLRIGTRIIVRGGR